MTSGAHHIIENDSSDEVVEARIVEDRGASMVEYALLLALVAMIAVGAVGVFGGGLSAEFSDIGSTVDSNLDAR